MPEVAFESHLEKAWNGLRLGYDIVFQKLHLMGVSGT